MRLQHWTEQLREVWDAGPGRPGFGYSGSGLLFAGREPEAVRRRILESAALAEPVREVRQEAEKLLEEPMPTLTYSLFRQFADSGSRSAYDKTYFQRRKRLTVFGIMAWLEPGNPAYAEELCNAVWSICEEYTWCLSAHLRGSSETEAELDDAHAEETGSTARCRLTVDLFAAETAFALSEVAALNEAVLPGLVRRRIREEVNRRVLEPFLAGPSYGWEKETHNWAAVCGGSVGAAALYLLGDGKRLVQVLERVLPAMDSYLQGFQEDGVCTEGYLYWQYGFGFYVYFADLLKQRTGGQVNLFADELVRNIALFQEKCFLDGRKVVNFSDSLPEAGIFMGLAHYLKDQYPGMDVPEQRLRAGFAEDHCSRWAPALRNLVWVRPEEQGRPWKSGSFYMKDAQWLVSRRIGEEGRFVFAAKGGHNDEPHNHNDVGHFIISAGGEPLLADMGSGLYTADYFGAGRYTILCNSSSGHSVPRVNGHLQRPGREAAAVVREMSDGEQETILELELSAAYDVPELKELIRRFSWTAGEDGRPRLLLRDTFSFHGEAGNETARSITERLICRVKPEPTEAGRVMLDGGQERLYIHYDEELLDCRTEALVHVDHFGVEQHYYALDVTVREPLQTQAVELAVTFS
jgi:hypothetical protein